MLTEERPVIVGDLCNTYVFYVITTVCARAEKTVQRRWWLLLVNCPRVSSALTGGRVSCECLASGLVATFCYDITEFSDYYVT